ncbi:MAG: hypothetical protein CMC70_05025 [Flavobacteriaceae bacterium]|nr:hypothetical protein [Flavobacteriaceae bacterium]
MNLDNFYKIQSRKLVDESSLSVTLQLNDAHIIYTGHFPNHPVLPGVAMFQIIKELSEEHFNTTFFMQHVSRAKFLNLVDPFQNNVLVFQLVFQQEENTLKVKNSTTFANGVSVMQCSLVFRELC